MRPNLSGVARVMGRMEELERRIHPERNENAPEREKSRFVDVLDDSEKKLRKAKPSVPGLVPDKPQAAKKAQSSSGGDWEGQISSLADKYGVEEALVRAVIKMESGGKTTAVSHKGAMGLMQLMPGTAKMLGVDDPFDPVQNLEGGIKYLSQLSDKYKGDLTKTLAAYNAGPGRVDACGGIPPFPETQNYVKNVLSMYSRNSGSDD
ncbi:MAG: lytic transglycosylase domain-containing protein [Synergistaceae bacterium]|nr:lytic transglycosylase domain-containing protein [Synergistaceae bacterium]